MPPSSRLPWAVERLDLRPADRVLEVGCGHGVAATAALERLTDGRYVGLDRSPKMVDAAVQRNAAAVADGRARFVVGEVPDVDLGDAGGGFDRILAARVAAMSRPPALAFAARHLRPGGRLALVVDSPGESHTRTAVAALVAALPPAGFAPPTVHETTVDGALVACVSAGLA
jgi:SAM-dependent methyltransferase